MDLTKETLLVSVRFRFSSEMCKQSRAWHHESGPSITVFPSLAGGSQLMTRYSNW